MGKQLTVAFIGNPNCGKTTLFNAYTGANLKVANWPGVTVERVEGVMKDHGVEMRLVDLPGTYSLTSYTMEEQVSRNFILSDEVDVIVDVVDASALERSLYLTLQLLELGKPVVVALNMMDIVEKRGMEIDLHRLPEMLGTPVIPVSARRRTGLEVLIHAAAHHADGKSHDPIIHEHEWHDHHGHHGAQPHHHHGQGHKHHHYAMVYDEMMEFRIDAIAEALEHKYPGLANSRWHAIKLLEGDEEVAGKCPVDLPHILDKNYETEIINQKYDLIEEIVEEVMIHREEKAAMTEKADRILTHPLLGLPIFLGIMAVVFFLTFTVGDFVAGYFEEAVGWFSGWVGETLTGFGVGPLLVALITDGIIAGVGSVLTLLPNIFILFLALAFLEDTGYMARVAYIMDGIMGRLGLSGRAFLPMVLGFGCSVPAIMASRVLESRRDRFKVMLITPFMSCSARLPIYILFSQLFFGKYAMAAAIAKFSGARHVIVTDMNPYRLDLAKKLGATETVNLKERRLSDVMKAVGMTEGFDVGLEMSGNAAGLSDMINNMKHGGKIALLGLLPKDTRVDMETVIFNGLNLRGIYGRKVWDTWYKMTTMIQSGLDIAPVITHRFDIKDFEKGFEVMISGQSGKVVLDWAHIND